MGSGWIKGVMQRDQAGLQVRKTNTSKLVALKNFNEELFSVVDDQHWHLGAHVQSISTDSESEAEQHEVIRPKPTTASVEITNITWQCVALFRKAIFDSVLGTVNVKRGAAFQTPSIASSSEGEVDILEDMVDQLLPVPDTPIVGSQNVWLREPIRKASTHMVEAMFPPNRDVLCRR